MWLLRTPCLRLRLPPSVRLPSVLPTAHLSLCLLQARLFLRRLLSAALRLRRLLPPTLRLRRLLSSASVGLGWARVAALVNPGQWNSSVRDAVGACPRQSYDGR